jgi:RNA polymerase sigma-70 factor (ECF subfamily)
MSDDESTIRPGVTKGIAQGGAKAPAAAQLSPGDGVSTGVSSVALNGALDGRFLARTSTPAVSGGEKSKVESLQSNASDPGSDAEVMLRVKAGDDDAFDYLVQKYRRPMMHFMYRTTRTVAAAEDLAQEVFLRVYRSRQNYEASAKFTTWLYRIATNLAMNHARDTKHERPENTVSVDAKNEETGLGFDVADSSLTVEQNLLRRERLMAIRECVLGLPDKQRTAVLMHKYQGMDYKQIAEVLKLSESATKSLLFRAYETLRGQLKVFV